MTPAPVPLPIVHVYGREVALLIDAKEGEHGQFRVALAVDGKERWAGHFTDKST